MKLNQGEVWAAIRKRLPELRDKMQLAGEASYEDESILFDGMAKFLADSVCWELDHPDVADVHQITACPHCVMFPDITCPYCNDTDQYCPECRLPKEVCRFQERNQLTEELLCGCTVTKGNRCPVHSDP